MPPWDGIMAGMADRLNALLMCYGRSTLKSVGINTGERQNWGSLEFRSLG